MFFRGIESILSQEDGIEIVGQDLDLEAAVACIQETHPDVVIVNCDDPDPRLKSAVVAIMRDSPGLNVVGLSLQNNQISIYRGEKKDVRQVGDLLNAIRD